MDEVVYAHGCRVALPAHRILHTAIRLARPDRKGGANASFATAIDLGIGLGAILLGWVSQYTSYQGLFMVSAVSVAFSLLVFTFVRRGLNIGARLAETGDVA